MGSDKRKSRVYSVEASQSHLYATYRYSAHTRGFSFELSKEEFLALTRQNCSYCGWPPTARNRSYTFTGVDRIDSQQGYVLGNVASACKVCNRAKNDLPLEVFLDWIRRIYDRSVRHGKRDVPGIEASPPAREKKEPPKKEGVEPGPRKARSDSDEP